jgi:hypothetical protein
MIFFIRTTKGLGNTAVYARLRNAIGKYWNFSTLAWDTVESSNTKIFMTEYADSDLVESLYESVDASIPAGGPWRQEAVLSSTGEVLGYDSTSVAIESTAISTIVDPLTSLIVGLVRDKYFAYIGNANNVVSKTSGNFVGLVHFYFVMMDDFLANPIAAPVVGNKICTLHPDGTMTDDGGLAVDGDILIFSLESFNCLDDLIINFYNDATKTNIRIYLPKDLMQSDSSVSYYPTTFGSIMTSNGAALVNISETAYGKALAMIPTINWDRLSAPIVIPQSTVLIDNPVQMILTKDRTIDLQFDLHRTLTAGDVFYFAMKTDKINDYYDIQPIECTIDDYTYGLISLTIPEDATVNLVSSKYYGELFRVTASGKYQTMVRFNIDLIPAIIATRDI